MTLSPRIETCDLQVHRADAHPAGVQNEIFPGQDFNNNRIMDFQTVDDWKSNELSKAEYGRMPWHDIAMGVIGPCIYDIAEHFVLRWNFCKRDKYKRDERYNWLTMTGRTGDNEDLIGVQRPKHPVGDYVNHPLSPLEHKRGNPHHAGKIYKNHDGPTTAGAGADDDEDEFHDASEYAEGPHGYTEDQHRMPDDWLEDHHIHKPHLHRDKTLPELPEGGLRNADGPERQEVQKMTGNDPSKEGTVSASGGVQEKSKAYPSEIVGHGVSGGYGTVRAQIVRSSADWSSGILAEQSIQNAYCQVIRGARHFVYIENQFFITATGDQQSPVHNIIGKSIVDACVAADEEGRKFRVIIVMPAIPGFAGDLRSDAAAGTRAIMDYQYKSINRGEHSIYGRLRAAGVDPQKYIFVFNLRSYDRLNVTPELRKEEEESGVRYHEKQRAQAEDVMGESMAGPENKAKSGPKKDPEHPAQATGIKGVAKKAGRDAAESSESESDLDDVPTESLDSNMDHSTKKKHLKERKNGVGLPGMGKSGEGHSHDSIAKDALLSGISVSEETYSGRDEDPTETSEEHREQEKENFVQEQLYIHGKVSGCFAPAWKTTTADSITFLAPDRGRSRSHLWLEQSQRPLPARIPRL